MVPVSSRKRFMLLRSRSVSRLNVVFTLIFLLTRVIVADLIAMLTNLGVKVIFLFAFTPILIIPNIVMTHLVTLRVIVTPRVLVACLLKLRSMMSRRPVPVEMSLRLLCL